MRSRLLTAMGGCTLAVAAATPTRRTTAVVVASALALGAALCPAGTRASGWPAYATADAGGFRNVLPAGQAGSDNVAALAAFQSLGARPAHWQDQLGLYTGLVRGSASLTDGDLGRYFKDATFGVRPDDIASVENPLPGLTVLRDKTYGVPHVYGDTRADVMFGTGWVGAEDRLFMMDVLRHAARAQLAGFAGGSADNREMDREQWQQSPYTEADLQRQIDTAPRIYGAAGRRIIDDGVAYVAGVNAYLARVRFDPTLLPSEYVAFGRQPAPWRLTDVIATASLIGGMFGRGGGREVTSALALEAFERRFGTRRGRRAWSDFRSKDDPEAPVTTTRRFPYETTSPFARRGLALPDPGSVRAVPTAPPVPVGVPTATGATLGARLLRALRGPDHASNALLVSAKGSRTGHPLAVMGPQVDYYVPEILMEEDLHGPGIDARGASFPGVNTYVQLGHGRDYAWSATSADADNVDTFAEVLCQDDFHYLYRGNCLQMDKLVRTNSWQPTLADDTPAGTDTLTAYRTVHGIVYARGTVRGHPVAFVSARSTYFHEADSGLGFAELNDPGFVRGPSSFRRAIADMNLTFNWFYADDRHIAYAVSGAYPQRARGVSPDFPVLGSGRYDWRGFDPADHLARWLPFARHPHALDPPFLVSWNNKQAPGWSASDANYEYGAIHRSQLLSDRVRRGLRHGRRMTAARLVTAMEEPATEDLRGVKLVPTLARALGRPRDPALAAAIDLLRRWHATGAHRRDLDGNGHYEDDAAVTLMDAWWPRLVEAAFGPVLGPDAFGRLRDVIEVGAEVGRPASAPDFETGWYGYVRKDLRSLFGPQRPRAWSRAYCGRGSRARCRTALRQSLRAALAVKRTDLYGRNPDCAPDPEASCHDMNRFTVVSAIDVPPFPFQARPTFQQVVDIRRRIPR